LGKVEGLTDANGNFTAEGATAAGRLGGIISKEGYYFNAPNTPLFDHFKDGHWLPWDGTYTTILRKVGNPIPMYVKIVDSEIPEVDQPCGYDLEAGDWVAPSGKGKIADFVVTLKRQYVNDRNYDDTVVLSFSNPGDGIQETMMPKEFDGSSFRWPREAPENGYKPNLTLHLWEDATGMHGERGDTITNKKYFFRVRTQKNGEQITSALYGKLNAGIELHPASSNTCGITFFYYLNPTSLDRNMEFDPKKDLFPGPVKDQRLREP
jgi:hypothetical protein